MRRPALRRTSALLASLLAGVLTLTACDFDGAYDLPLPGSPVDADDSYEITADFNDILNIVPRSPVMVDDVTVGEVTEVERVGWHARVTLRIRDDVELPDNAVAQVKQVSLLGEKYIALDDPAGAQPTGKLADGDHIGLDETARSPEVEEVLGALSMLLSGGGVGQLSTIFDELNQLMDGRQDKLRNVLGNLRDVVGTLDEQKGDILRALEAVNSLTATLNAEKKTITDALDATGPAIAVLREQHDNLIAMLTGLEQLGEVGTRVIRKSKDDLLDSLRELQPVLAQLNAAGDDLAPGLSLAVSFPFPPSAANIIQGDYADTSAIFDVNLAELYPDPAGIPPIVPDPVDVLDGVLKCLQSGSLTSQACLDVLADVDLFNNLREQCLTAEYRGTAICQAVNAIPLTQDLPGLDDLLNLNLPLGLKQALAGANAAPEPTARDLYGGTS